MSFFISKSNIAGCQSQCQFVATIIISAAATPASDNPNDLSNILSATYSPSHIIATLGIDDILILIGVVAGALIASFLVVGVLYCICFRTYNSPFTRASVRNDPIELRPRSIQGIATRRLLAGEEDEE